VANRVQINMSYEDAIILRDLATDHADSFREANDLNDPVKLTEWAELDRLRTAIAVAVSYSESQ
jgi:hypothetical protein